jgi:hypothetical protein
MIRPLAAYHEVACTLPMKFASQASPTVGTVLLSAMAGPSCMSSTALGVTQTKAGGLAASRLLWTLLKLTSGTTLALKSAREVTAGK